jgi:hypothetical protein
MKPRSKSEWMTREDGARVGHIERALGKKVECAGSRALIIKSRHRRAMPNLPSCRAGRTPGKEGQERVGLESKKDKFHWISSFFHDNDRFKAKEGILPKRPGAYKSEKRRKELSRQKKQEERRERKFQKGDRAPSDAEKVEQESNQPPNP